MIESELHPPPHEPHDPGHDFGPPVLLKRLGNAVEANLAKNKLETAGIPSFLGGENAFAGDIMHPLPYREVELFVPQSMAAEALDVLEAPPDDPSELSTEPYLEDPARAWSFRAFVCAIVGWCFFTLAAYGFVLSLPVFLFAVFLSFRAIAASTDRSPGTILKVIVAVLIAAAGIAADVAVFLTLIR